MTELCGISGSEEAVWGKYKNAQSSSTRISRHQVKLAGDKLETILRRWLFTLHADYSNHTTQGALSGTCGFAMRLDKFKEKSGSLEYPHHGQA